MSFNRFTEQINIFLSLQLVLSDYYLYEGDNFVYEASLSMNFDRNDRKQLIYNLLFLLRHIIIQYLTMQHIFYGDLEEKELLNCFNLGQIQPESDKNQFNRFSYSYDDSWIEELLNPEALEKTKQSPTQDRVSEEESQHQSFEDYYPSQQSLNVQRLQKRQHFYDFHNVQKHLITYLRRVHLRRTDFLKDTVGVRAYQLWKIFKNSKESTKRCLYVVFGVSQDHNQQNLIKMAQHYPQLNKILAKCSFEQIYSAQAFIRKEILHAISETPKNIIKSQCKMHNFEEFYIYLTTFLAQLQHGEPSMRIAKQKKEKALSQQDFIRERTEQ